MPIAEHRVFFFARAIGYCSRKWVVLGIEPVVRDSARPEPLDHVVGSYVGDRADDEDLTIIYHQSFPRRLL